LIWTGFAALFKDCLPHRFFKPILTVHACLEVNAHCIARSGLNQDTGTVNSVLFHGFCCVWVSPLGGERLMLFVFECNRAAAQVMYGVVEALSLLVYGIMVLLGLSPIIIKRVKL
jgi:hypothetical protein